MMWWRQILLIWDQKIPVQTIWERHSSRRSPVYPDHRNPYLFSFSFPPVTSSPSSASIVRKKSLPFLIKTVELNL